ncbi:2OG-Fe(II) oxygenase [Dokdonella sp.]|uniref:2OG-Fe(II) oxygenase n=1 Tax=Dokdonella sp. TaxID=2291710 RepID=UPI0027B8AD4D|nr:2OG-Fe(II) oxygenase [Dokdonella sp.]
MDDFIEIYPSALQAETCRQIIAAFEDSGKATRGATAGGVNTQLKDSWDLSINKHAEWREVVGLFNATMLQCLMQYVRKYTYLALAPTALYRKAPDGRMTQLGADDIRGMDDAGLRRLITHVFRPGDVNVQRYFANEGGYPYWHSETSPKLGDMDNLHRVLLWTCYLNDDFDEGETEFMYQQRKVTPKVGSLLIAPAGFTHTHRGNQPKRGNKYIATSWILFQPAEQLYAAPGAPS